MRHIFLIDPLEKLKLYKDSSLMLALTSQKLGYKSLVLFTSDFLVGSKSILPLKASEFSGNIKTDFYLDNFRITNEVQYIPEKDDIFHFRPDPPIDSNYINLAWMTHYLKTQVGFTVINDAMGTLSFNEKMLSFNEHNSLASIVSNNFNQVKNFIEKNKFNDFIAKPLNLFSGIGVKRYSISDLEELKERFKDDSSMLLIQEFDQRVFSGEVRSIFWNMEYLGSVLKKPSEGNFLTNTSQGSEVADYQLDKTTILQCKRICEELLDYGVKLVAFDILGGNISEVNITCPSLLVELSHIKNENLCERVIGTSFEKDL